MKRPLKPSEVPPGSVLRFKTCENPQVWASPIIVDESGVVVAVENGSQMTFLSYYTLKANWLIKRPGQAWQPCYVEEFSVDDYKPGQEVDWLTARKLKEAGAAIEYRETNGQWVAINHLPNPIPLTVYRLAKPFNPADYRPGEEVDVETARKLHAAGVKLECSNYSVKWEPVCTIFNNNDEYISLYQWKFRIVLPPKMRDLRPDELPPRFEVVWPDGAHCLWDKDDANSEHIHNFNAHGCKWRTDLNATELNSFQVEDK